MAPEGKDNVKGQACLVCKRNSLGKKPHIVPALSRTSTPSPWRGRGGGEGSRLRRGRLVVQGVPQDASRQSAGMAPVFEQHLAIHDGVVDPLGEFPDPPAAGR